MYGRLTVTVQLSRGLPGLSPQAVQFSGQTERYTAAFIEVAPQLKKRMFSNLKIDKFRAFYSISLNVSYKNLLNPKPKSFFLLKEFFRRLLSIRGLRNKSCNP